MRGEGSVRKTVVRRGAWTPEEDTKLKNYINRYGIWNWVYIPKYAGLTRSGKSCRLRWMNYLNPNVKRGNYSPEEDEVIINMRRKGAGWAAIAEKLPGRTDNEIKNRWCAHLKKRGLSNPTNESVEEPEIQIDDLELRLGLPGWSENRISEGPTFKG